MYLLRRIFAFFFPESTATQPPAKKRMLQSFILEPILTPSGLVDDPTHAIVFDINPHSVDDIAVDHLDAHPVVDVAHPILTDDVEPIPFIHSAEVAANPIQPTFDSGVFTVGETGQVSIDFLADGGGYQGQVAIFSLDGMEHFEAGSQAFIQEAAHRALSDSILGHIVIADQTEGAKFSGDLGEANTNYGDYLGVKTFTMNAGDKFGIMLVPNGTVQQVFDNPSVEGDLHPLFSMATANPNEAFHIGQIADVTGHGNTFVMEDMRVDTGSDHDYNDIIFQVKGATGTAVHLDDVIDHNHDWRDTDSGKEIIDYATPKNFAPESLQFSTERFYTADEAIKLSSAKVFDADGISDITKVDFWVRHDGGEWQDISDATQFTANSDGYGTFNYELHDLTAGHYELKGIAYDHAGETSNTFTENFTVLSLPKSDALPETVRYSIEQAINLDNYTPEELANIHQWVVSVQSGQNPADLAASLGATNLGLTGHIPNTYVWQFTPGSDPFQLSQQLNGLKGIEFAYPDVASEVEPQYIPNDPLFSQQWNFGTDSNSTDNNITEAYWQANGKGVVVGVVDTGVDYNHPDLKDNYRADLSRDFVENTGAFNTYDSNPMPVGTSPVTAHGTAIAGIIAAVGNNNIGISGVAPEVDFAALRFIDTSTTTALVTDQQIADTLSYVNDDIDIYNNSWGLVTNFNPKPMGVFELHAGATEGRDGLGNVYVFAAGNDAQNGDNVNYDAFANSRYAIAVGAVDYNGQETTYSNPGASLLISTFSSGAGKGVITTDLTGASGYNLGDYTNTFGGTSAAAATISGVVALMLQANSTLTWRDIKAILAETAQKNDPTDADWVQNGAGYWVNDKFGFGLVDAQAAVQTARNWQKLTSEVKVSASEILNGKTGIKLKDNQTVERKFTINDDITVESVEVVFDAKHQNRGDLEVKLISPDGTESILAAPRNDTADNYQKWVFTSNRNWGESSQGDWKLQVTDKNGNGVQGDWNSWKLNVYGTKPTVSMITTDYDAHENGDQAEFTITRTGNTENALTVNFNVWGSATPNSDYQAIANTATNQGSITIPAGASSVKIPIIPIDDAETEWWEENIGIGINSDNAYLVGNQSNWARVRDNETPVVYMYPYEPVGFTTNNYASESSNNGYFRLWVMGSIDNAITVNYSLAGTAINGVDYEALSGNVTISASQNNGIQIKPINDNLVEGNETVEVKLEAGSGYIVGTPTTNWDKQSSGSLTIVDNDDRPTITIKTTDLEASESGDPGQFAIYVTDNNGNPLTLTQPLTVNYDLWGPTNGVDYNLIPSNSITIPVGADHAVININPIADTEIEGDQWIDIRLKADNAYALGLDEDEWDHVLLKEDSRLKWLSQVGTSGYDYANSVAVDSAGNVYTTGRTSGSLGGVNTGLYDGFITKHDSNGNLIWKQQLGTVGYDTSNSIALDSAGNIYINGWTDGSFDGTTADRDAFIAKYDNNGNKLWVQEFGSSPDPTNPNAGYDFSNGGMTVGSNGSLYIVGSTYGSLGATTAGEADAFVTKYDSNGNWQWAKQLGTAAWDEAKGVAVDNAGNVFITGHTKGNLASPTANQGDADAWVAKYDSSGNQTWIKQLGTVTEDVANAVAVDNLGSVYISGSTRGSDFNNPSQLLNSGDTNAFLAKFDSNSGNFIWSRQHGWGNYDTSTGIAADSAGNVYITGRTIHSDNNVDAWVAHYTSNGDGRWWQPFGGGTEQASNSIALNSTGFYIAGYTGESLNGQTYLGNTDAWVAKFV